MRRPLASEPMFDFLGEDLAENIRPVVIRRDPDPVPRRRRREAVPIIEQRRQIDIGVRGEGLADGDDLRLRERIANASAPDEVARRPPPRRRRHQPRAVLIDAQRRLLGAIPFEHGEFRMMQRRALAVAEHPRQGENPLLARPRAASCTRIPARCGDRAGSRAAIRADQLGREGGKMGFIAAGDLKRGGFDLGETFRRRKNAASPRLSRCAP